MAGILKDIKAEINDCCYETGDVNKLRSSVSEEFGAIVKFLGDKKFLVGDYVTYVDFIFYEQNELLQHVTKDHFDNFPSFKAYNERVASLVQINKYLKSERNIFTRFNNKCAKI